MLPGWPESIRDPSEELSEFGPAGSPSRLVWAIRSVNKQREQRDLLRRRLGRQSLPVRAPVREMIRMYEDTTDTCVCCD